MLPSFSLLLVYSHLGFPLKLHLKTANNKDVIIDLPDEIPDNTEFEIEIPEENEVDNNNNGLIVSGKEKQMILNRKKKLSQGLSKLNEAREVVANLKEEANVQEEILAEKEVEANKELEMITDTMKNPKKHKSQMQSLETSIPGMIFPQNRRRKLPRNVRYAHEKDANDDKDANDVNHESMSRKPGGMVGFGPEDLGMKPATKRWSPPDPGRGLPSCPLCLVNRYLENVPKLFISSASLRPPTPPTHLP